VINPNNWPLIKKAGGALTLYIEVKPGASKTEMVGTKEDANGIERVLIKLTAQAHDGEANKALIEYVAKTLKVPKTKIEITTGLKSRVKTLTLYVEAP
jgi:uncharacterized protein (TIGR00251 family)